MGEGDLMPIGRRRHKPDPERARKIREGGKIADRIRKITEKHHEKEEVPAAEEELLKDLESLNNN